MNEIDVKTKDQPIMTEEERLTMERRVLSEIQDEASYRLKSKMDNKSIFLTMMVMKARVKVGYLADTACVYVDNSGVAIITINPLFWKVLNNSIKFSVLVHEIFHVVMNHFIRTEKPEDSFDAKLQNIAMDCAINQYIQEFSNEDSEILSAAQLRELVRPVATQKQLDKIKKGIKPVNIYSFRKMIKKGMEVDEHETFEYYYKLLRKHREENPPVNVVSHVGPCGDEQTGGGNKDNDNVYAEDHSPSHDKQKENGDNELGHTLFRESMRRTMSQAGVAPSDFGIDLQDRKKINWKQYVRMFMNKAIKSNLKKTKNRPNRRYGYKAPRRIKNKTTEIDVLVDTSGSMAEVIDIIFSELVNLAYEQVDFFVYCVDTQLHMISKVKSKSDITKLEIPKYGGTDFTKALVELNKRTEKRPLLFITDTYGGFPDSHPNYQLLILATESEIHNSMPEWARSITLDISHLVYDEEEEVSSF